MSVVSEIDSETTTDRYQYLADCLEIQRSAALAGPAPDLAQRRNDLQTLIRFISDHHEAMIEAISSDYGNRSRHETMYAELITTLDGIRHDSKHLKGWMRVQKREVDQSVFTGGKAVVVPQPLGVVGIIVPWNFPAMLTFVQVAAAFAAGNRAMVKMSENSTAFSELLINKVGDYFPPEKLSFFAETGEVGIAFSSLPFDLMVFTGSGEVGRKVMAAAAENLTPVVLELGGKAPAVIAPDYPMQKAVERILFAKQYNAGQICTNADYVFVHEDQCEEFVSLAARVGRDLCPDIESADYTSIIDDRSMERLLETIDDARSKGATVIKLSDQEPQRGTRKLPLHLVLDTTPEMIIRQRETFGPLLMVMTYRTPEEVIDYVNGHDRPLAFYPFSNNDELVERYIERIMSGGVTVNDIMFHVAQHDLPFGGVGPSGMGHYHGYEGFQTFSKMRPVYLQPGFTAAKFLTPPYGALADKVLGFLLKRKT